MRLFEGIEKDHLSSLLTCLGARIVRAKKGETVLTEGSPARDIGVLLSGRIHLIRIDYYGNRSIFMHLAKGELFAESFACAMADSLPVSAVAAEDSDIMLIDCARLMTSCSNACEFHNRIIFNLLKITTRKNLALHQKNLLNSKRTTREKLLSYLLMQAKNAKSDRFTIPFDRQSLSEYLNVDRSGLSTELGKLKKEGIYRFSQKQFPPSENAV